MKSSKVLEKRTERMVFNDTAAARAEAERDKLTTTPGEVDAAEQRLIRIEAVIEKLLEAQADFDSTAVELGGSPETGMRMAVKKAAQTLCRCA